MKIFENINIYSLINFFFFLGLVFLVYITISKYMQATRTRQYPTAAKGGVFAILLIAIIILVFNVVIIRR